MDEKIREIGEEIWNNFSKKLYLVTTDRPLINGTPVDFKLFADSQHASARQRCEAAWLTFNGTK